MAIDPNTFVRNKREKKSWWARNLCPFELYMLEGGGTSRREWECFLGIMIGHFQVWIDMLAHPFAHYTYRVDSRSVSIFSASEENNPFICMH